MKEQALLKLHRVHCMSACMTNEPMIPRWFDLNFLHQVFRGQVLYKLNVAPEIVIEQPEKGPMMH